jgi:hypothetical protein
MAPRRLSATSPGDLLAYLLSPRAGVPPVEAAADSLADELAGWLRSQPRFRAFADAHKDKIRKKLRLARDANARSDVRAELLVARHLLDERRMDLAFEAAGTRSGGPDFTVTFRGGPSFNLEVTRPRQPVEAPDATRAILPKLRQLPSGAANVLLLAVAGDIAAWDVAGSVRAVRTQADAKEEEFFTRRGFAGTRDFYERFLRLSAVITWSEAGGAAGRAEAWVNGSARTAVPARALRACVDALLSRSRRPVNPA